MAKYEDLTGQRFGRLVVLRRGDDQVLRSGTKRVMWICRCDCGSEKRVAARHLKNGSAQSCGCYARESTSKRYLEDLTGRKFGKLTVVGRDDGRTGGPFWRCECDCGSEITVSAGHLRTGHTRSCGCFQKEKASSCSLDDLTGQRFGRLTVLKRDPDRTGQVFWHCKCDCGNEKSVSAYRLKSGRTQSCGCLSREVAAARMETIRKNPAPKNLLVDLTGQRFGRLTVTGRDPNRTGGTYWRCKCDCGNEKSVLSGSLRLGRTRSCGCLAAESARSRAEDLTGQKFGRLTALERDRSRTDRVFWRCGCVCGNETIVTAKGLKSGQTRSCGCFARESASGLFKEDLTGQRFGRLTVIKQAPNKAAKVAWLCKCDCGNEKRIQSGHLKSGSIQSCGCLVLDAASGRIEDLTGQRFGKLTVIRQDPDRTGGTYWHCKCDCGNTKSVNAGNLKSGELISCGCLTISRQEFWLETLLKAHRYEFQRQVTFEGLTGTGGRKLSYDFAVYRQQVLACLVECQGKQHYESVGYFGGDAKFQIQQTHDSLKRTYAQQQLQVPLIEIPYWNSENDMEALLLPGGAVYAYVQTG